MANTKTNPDNDVDRTYFKIEPAADAADLARLEDAFRRLHNQRRFFQLECLVVARGDGVAYYVGTDTEHARSVDHTLHSIFPDETTISNPDTAPNLFLDDLAAEVDTNDTDPSAEDTTDDQQTPSETEDPPAADTPPAAAVRYRGRAMRQNDWQIQLQDALERDVVRPPLASVVDTLANAPDDTVAV